MKTKLIISLFIFTIIMVQAVDKVSNIQWLICVITTGIQEYLIQVSYKL